MASITISQEKFDKVLEDVETLIEDVTSLFDQDELVTKRLTDIRSDPSISKSEEEFDEYLKKEG